MEKEISGIVMLGIVLMAVAVLIGLGFNIFSTAKSTANDGVTKVQTNLANVAASEFADYDQTVVTGTQVKSAYQNFVGKNVAILISTQAVADQAKGNPYLLQSGAGITSAGEHKNRFKPDKGDSTSVTSAVTKTIRYGSPDAKLVAGNGIKISNGTQVNTGSLAVGAPSFVTVKSSNGKEVYPAIYVNYNAIINAPDGVYGGTGVTNAATYFTAINADSASAVTNQTMYINEGKVIAQGGFLTDDTTSQVLFNGTIANMNKSGMLEYLSPTSKFNANLIVDSTNTTIGIVFTQINTN